MTEWEWWQSEDSPTALLERARQSKVLSHRKSLLYGCGCYRLIWDRFSLPSIREAVEKAEMRADRKLSQQALEKHRHPEGEVIHGTANWFLQLYMWSLLTPKMTPSHVAWVTRAAIQPEIRDHSLKYEGCKPQADLVREIFRNPFRPVSFDPNWSTSTAVALAKQMYESRDFSAMPILADALEDAGCDNQDVLDHSRGGRWGPCPGLLGGRSRSWEGMS